MALDVGKEGAAMTRWHITYKARVRNYPDGIVWCADFTGTLVEAINWIHREEDIIEIVDIYER